MKYSQIEEMVKNAILYDDKKLLEIRYSSNNRHIQYAYSTAVRLVKIWFKLKQNSIYKVDFECSLRNYLLLLKCDIYIKDYNPSDRFNNLGLNIEHKSGRIWCDTILPKFSNGELVKQLYTPEVKENKTDVYHNLDTNNYIKKLTGFNKFKSNEQKLAVMGALKVPSGFSCLVSMTTGGGKSLITQTIAYQEEGLTIVVVPTVSLMLDQYYNACEIIKSETNREIFYHYSNSELSDFYSALDEKKARILFISPESLIKNQKLRTRIQKCNEEGYLKNIVVDEAHIVVDWGTSFRVDFQCLDVIRKELVETNKHLRTFLLSATYTDETIRELKMFYNDNDNWIEIRCEKLRHETRYDIVNCLGYNEKKRRIIESVDLLPRPMIVYVKSPNDADELKTLLNSLGYNNIHTYTGETSADDRQRIIDLWKDNSFDLLIATCAFGVGVDKEDVRTVLHTYVPETPNKYYQEAGRGGRDGNPCLSTMLYTNRDIDDAFKFVSKVITTQKLKGRWFSMLNSEKTNTLYNSKYMLDTYVKPEYNSDEVYIDYINDQDVFWNVYVVLFLRRNGLISIDKVVFENNRYLFYITVLKREILNDSKETEDILNNVREQERQREEKEFRLMKTGLKNTGKTCWSDMFTKVYRKTNIYCAGCNEHNSIVNFEDEKTLKVNLNFPLTEVAEEIRNYTYNCGTTLIVDDGIKNLSKALLNKIDVIVATNKVLKTENINKISNKKLLLCNYYDFIELFDENKYYTSGAILIYFPEDVYIQKKIINIIDKIKISHKDNIQFLIYSQNDMFLSFRNKYLSEVIDHNKNF